MRWQITILIFGIFLIYAIIQQNILHRGAESYENQLFRMTEAVFKDHSEYQLEGIMNSTAIQAEEYFNIQFQLIARQAKVVASILSEATSESKHPINFLNESIYSIDEFEVNSQASNVTLTYQQDNATALLNET